MRGVFTVHAATCADDSMTATWESPRVGRTCAQMVTAVPISRETFSYAEASAPLAAPFSLGKLRIDTQPFSATGMKKTSNGTLNLISLLNM